MRRSKTNAKRFFEKIDQTGECWLWIGEQRDYGAGNFYFWECDHYRSAPAHMASWEFHHGPIPAGQRVLQMCLNFLCVNPAHLRLSSSRLTLIQHRYLDRDIPHKPRGCPERDWNMFTEHAFMFRSYEDLAAEHGMPLTTARSIVGRVSTHVERPAPDDPDVLAAQPPGVSDRDWAIYQRRMRDKERLKAIGIDYGISKERVRQVVNAVKRKGAVSA